MYVKLRETDSTGLAFIAYNSNLFSNIVTTLSVSQYIVR